VRLNFPQLDFATASLTYYSTQQESLRVNTINGAYKSHEGAIKKSITPGKLADFVLLSGDLVTVDKEKIKDLQIVRTVVGGTTV
jgi:hypothetical protein